MCCTGQCSPQNGHVQTSSDQPLPAWLQVQKCSCQCSPPYTQAVRSLGAVSANSRSTCLASSRVGASTMQRGSLLRLPPSKSSAISFSMTGRAKARVLPEPVRARPIKSRPACVGGLQGSNGRACCNQCGAPSHGPAGFIPKQMPVVKHSKLSCTRVAASGMTRWDKGSNATASATQQHTLLCRAFARSHRADLQFARACSRHEL